MAPLLDAIIQHVPPPRVDPTAAFSMCVAMIERDPYVGRLATGRVFSGRVRVGDRVRVLQHAMGGGNGGGRGERADSGGGGGGGGGPVVVEDLRVTRLEKRVGLSKVQLPEAVAGDIVQLAGAGDAAGIADTIAAPGVEEALDPGPIDPPTLRCGRRGMCMGLKARAEGRDAAGERLPTPRWVSLQPVCPPALHPSPPPAQHGVCR
jgi:GTP-binding protein